MKDILSNWHTRNIVLSQYKQNISKEDIASTIGLPLSEVNDIINQYIIIRKKFKTDAEYILWKKGMDAMYLLMYGDTITRYNISVIKNKLYTFYIKQISNE